MVDETQTRLLTRRESLAAISAAALTASLPGCWIPSSKSASDNRADWRNYRSQSEPKSVAMIMTVWYPGSHSDVFARTMLEGWDKDDGPGPNLRFTSMFVEQFPDNDRSREYSEKYGVPIFETIEEALTLGTDGIDVDGVLLIGEHGKYPVNEKLQDLYPRREFFDQIADTFEKHGRVVPVFNDKHFGPSWDDAKWTYDRAQAMDIPMMAGSSLPFCFREPDLALPMGCEIETIVAVGYAAPDRYGIHALEFVQSFAERRRGGETGIKWAQCLTGDAMWQAADDGRVAKEAMEAAFRVVTDKDFSEARKLEGDWIALYLFEYLDGLTGAVFMLHRFAGRCGLAVQLKGERAPRVTSANEIPYPKVPHFSYQLYAIEQMFHTGKPTYPVERTLLTTGLLDRLLTNRIEGQRPVSTPELAIRYEGSDYPHAPNPLIETRVDKSYTRR